ncbi:hypothetical protein GOV10_01645 [Candidatus Woesearchaeota archaeon]|nr:hypothetical protein [Candidatus Woesearchaeota archaeon]
MSYGINIDSILKHIPEDNVKIQSTLQGFIIDLYAGPEDMVRDSYFDKKTKELHLTLDLFRGTQAGLKEIYHARFPEALEAVVVDEVIYRDAHFNAINGRHHPRPSE